MSERRFLRGRLGAVSMPDDTRTALWPCETAKALGLVSKIPGPALAKLG